MANVLLEYGPYNSKADSKREYDAKDIGRMFDGIVTDGVFPYIGQKFTITKHPEALKINVGTGRAWLNHTWNNLESPMIFKLENGDPVYKRYDAVVLQIGCSELVRENRILIKKGTASENPVPPALEIYEDSQYEYVIGYIEVDVNANDIESDSKITNLVGVDSDPNGFYKPGEFLEWAYAIGDNHIGVKRITVPYNPETVESDWQEIMGTDNITPYYYREIPNITGILDNAIFTHDLWTEGLDIVKIQKQENSYSYLFRIEVQNNTLKLYSYYRPDVEYTIRFVGKGINNI